MNKQDCEHKTIHTERLMSRELNDAIKTGDEKAISAVKNKFVIEKYCADCGRVLGTVAIWIPETEFIENKEL